MPLNKQNEAVIEATEGEPLLVMANRQAVK